MPSIVQAWLKYHWNGASMVALKKAHIPIICTQQRRRYNSKARFPVDNSSANPIRIPQGNPLEDPHQIVWIFRSGFQQLRLYKKNVCLPLAASVLRLSWFPSQSLYFWLHQWSVTADVCDCLQLASSEEASRPRLAGRLEKPCGRRLGRCAFSILVNFSHLWILFADLQVISS